MKINLALSIGLLGFLPNAAPAQGEDYRPLPKPLLVIGTEGQTDYEFLGINAAYRLPDGSIVVADRQTSALRIFDSAGRLVRTLGRKGEGPGEFQIASVVSVAGDTIVAFDFAIFRLTTYKTDGTLLGTQPLLNALEGGRAYIEGRLQSGHWAVSTPHSPGWSHGPGVYRDTLRVGIVDRSGTGKVRWVGGYPGATLFAYMPGENKRLWAAGWLFYAPTSLVEVTGDSILVGDTGRPELLLLRSDGQVARRIPLPISAPDLRAYRTAERDKRLAESKDEREKGYIQAAHNVPRPPTYYKGLLVSSTGELWINLYEESFGAPVRYLVLGRNGKPRARVSVPAGSRVINIQTPWVLVVQKDENDIERLGLVRWTPP